MRSSTSELSESAQERLLRQLHLAAEERLWEESPFHFYIGTAGEQKYRQSLQSWCQRSRKHLAHGLQALIDAVSAEDRNWLRPFDFHDLFPSEQADLFLLLGCIRVDDVETLKRIYDYRKPNDQQAVRHEDYAGSVDRVPWRFAVQHRSLNCLKYLICRDETAFYSPSGNFPSAAAEAVMSENPGQFRELIDPEKLRRDACTLSIHTAELLQRRNFERIFAQLEELKLPVSLLFSEMTSNEVRTEGGQEFTDYLELAIMADNGLLERSVLTSARQNPLVRQAALTATIRTVADAQQLLEKLSSTPKLSHKHL